MAIEYRKFLSLGMLDPRETPSTRTWARVFDVIMLLVVFWLPMQWYAQYKGEISTQFVFVANWVVWSLFVLEAVVMTLLVKYKLYYLETNWLNLFIIVAVFPPFWVHHSSYFAVLRYLRFVVILRLLLPQLMNVYRILTRNHFGATLFVLLIVTLLSGILITYIDPAMGSPWEGIWWAWQTVTTVGYGDVVPNTWMGRIFASILMLAGVGLFSLVSANLAAYFIERGRRQKEKKPERQVQKQFREMHERMQCLEQSNQRLEDLLVRILSKMSDDKEKVKETPTTE